MTNKDSVPSSYSRRTFIAGAAVAALSVGAGSLLFGCDSKSEQTAQTSSQAAPAQLDYNNWDSVLAAARGTTVTHAGYSGDDALNAWINNALTKTLKEKYDITLRYARDLDTTMLLTDNKQAGASDTAGTFDTAWVNGQTFRDPQELGLWFGPITDKLPNFKSYVDAENQLVNYDFTYPNAGFEAPFSRAQIVLINDSKKTPEKPASTDELMAYAKKYPGKLTYPSADNWLGSAFVRTIIYNIVGYEQFQSMAADESTIKAAIEPALAYLRELNPYLWKKGATFPADHAALETLFLSGEANTVVTYGTYDCGINIKSGLYPATAQAFILDKGTCANMSYWAVAWDAPNKPAALVAINEMLSPELQLAKFQEGEPYVLDLDKLPADVKQAFEQVDLGPNNVLDSQLAEHALPEYAGTIEALVTKIWKKEVVGKHN